MKVHLLTGDSLAELFKQTAIEGEIIISRECLIVGELAGNQLADFWQTRANYIRQAYGEANYHQHVALEYEKLLNLPPSSELYLWFEYDLFCRVNLWFSLWLIQHKNYEAVFRVAPVSRIAQDRWKGFGGMDIGNLHNCYESKTKFTAEDITLGANLWQAYQNGDLEQLQKLSENTTSCFPYVQEVCKAHIERVHHHRPEKILQQIMNSGIIDFTQIFNVFSLTEGIYGFGDSQVREIYNTLTK